MKIKSPLLLGLLFSAAPSWAYFYERGLQSLSVDMDLTLPLTEVDLPATFPSQPLVGDVGAGFGVEYFYFLSPRWAVGAGYNYSFASDHTPTISFLNVREPTLSTTSNVFLAETKYLFRIQKQIMPYLLGGLGMHNTSRKITAVPGAFSSWFDTGTTEERTLVDDSGTSYALAAGAGVDFAWGLNWIFSTECRYTYMGSVDYQPTAAGFYEGITDVNGDTQQVAFMFKLGRKF